MKTLIYIPVKVEEELPAVEDIYTIIINGVKSVSEFHLYENLQPHLHIKAKMWTKDDRHGYEYEVTPGYWLKPVDMPSEEEIQKMAHEYAKETPVDYEAAYADFIEGAKAILTKLNGER